MLTRRIIHATATIAIAAATVLVLDQTGLRASHQFNDVGNGNFFHESIGAIGSAGCASGFNDGSFRPNSNPTRGQFAYWTHNCGGRIAHDRGVSFTVSGLNQLANVSVTAGALDNPPIDTGGYVWVSATAEASDGSNTSCEVAISMRRNGVITDSLGLNPTGSNSTNWANGQISRVVAIDGGATDAYDVRASSSGCLGGSAAVEVGLTAMYVPFDGAGNGGGSGASPSAQTEVGPESL